MFRNFQLPQAQVNGNRKQTEPYIQMPWHNTQASMIRPIFTISFLAVLHSQTQHSSITNSYSLANAPCYFSNQYHRPCSSFCLASPFCLWYLCPSGSSDTSLCFILLTVYGPVLNPYRQLSLWTGILSHLSLSSWYQPTMQVVNESLLKELVNRRSQK